LCMWTDDTLLKLQLVQRDDVWRVVEIVQVDTDLRIAAGTLGPTIQSIQDNRAGKKTTPAPFSEFIQALTLMNSDPAKGVEAANRILQTKPGDRSVRLLKAYGLFALDKVDEGIKLLTELSDEQPAYPAALYRLASMLSETEPAKSIELYKRYSLLEPNDPRSYRELAVLYEDSNQPALAEAAYRKTIAADPRTRWNYVNLIGFLLSNDRFGEVEAVLTAADKQLAADNDLLAATIYELQDEIKLVDAQRLAANHPEKMKTSAWANVSLAKIYMRDGQHLPALEWLNRAAQIDTEYAAPHFLMSEAYLKLSRVNEAVKAAEEAVLVEPENASGHYRRACALAQLGRRRDAMLALEKAVELDPDYLSEISDDPELKTLKSLPAFKKLVQGQQDPK
ncbi:MAG TPA: tetratricopeptide repeat protein, partial [Pyrinomonadaceae bacterium]|nr:tetratricopeptide repeat protein [Pyrinomonadaceae bacterium]